MGVDWLAIDQFFIDDELLYKKFALTQEHFVKIHGLWSDKK